jgi:carbonic anhydrase
MWYHIVNIGHYKCGAVGAGIGPNTGDRDLEVWIKQIRQLASKYESELKLLEPEQRHDMMCALNALENTAKLVNNPAVQSVWAQGNSLTLHAWCYQLSTGLLENLGFTVNSPNCAVEMLNKAISLVISKYIGEREQ